MSVLEKIEAQYMSLTKKEKQIALYVLQHPSEIKTSTITELASKIGTSPALITHFCKKIDNLSFMDLKLGISSIRERENIVQKAPYVDDMQIIKAAKVSGVDEYVNAHPLGFDMPVFERGDGISGGQRQRIAVARGVFFSVFSNAEVRA